MSALPVDPSQRADPLDPERILHALPDRERETFLGLWAWRAIAVAEPGYYEDRERARAGTGGGMLFEDALRQYRPLPGMD
jgi:hypothetical protein